MAHPPSAAPEAEARMGKGSAQGTGHLPLLLLWVHGGIRQWSRVLPRGGPVLGAANPLHHAGAAVLGRASACEGRGWACGAQPARTPGSGGGGVDSAAEL